MYNWGLHQQAGSMFAGQGYGEVRKQPVLHIMSQMRRMLPLCHDARNPRKN